MVPDSPKSAPPRARGLDALCFSFFVHKKLIIFILDKAIILYYNYIVSYPDTELSP